ncbi:MAG: electron transfer flavoprotein subunit alpha/FixB family protein [Nitrospinota bacterium]|nr:electron transfer flavoprotein subunit alpha/FixB family protein [Nitrospinota bacterium]
MKVLLVAEQRKGKLLDSVYELIAFAGKLGAESAMFLAGSEGSLPKYNGKLYLADAEKCGEINTELHKKLLLDVIAKEKPEYIVFSHSSYGWDIAPRIAFALKAAQVSEVVDVNSGKLVVPACNSKLRVDMKPGTAVTVVTLQTGAFSMSGEPSGTPAVEIIDIGDVSSTLEFTGYEESGKTGIDLTKAESIVSVGRGIGKKEDIEIVKNMADVLGSELGASRPVVDAGWLESNRQVGVTGQTVSPKVYFACGISGAIQHLAGMKKSEFIVAINTDKDAPIGEVADVLVVADMKQFIPVFTEKVKSRKK